MTTQKLILWANSKSENVTTKNLNCDKTKTVRKLKNSIFDITQKIKFGPNSKLKLWQHSKLKSWQLNFLQNFKKSFGKNNLTPQQPMICDLGSLLWSLDDLNKKYSEEEKKLNFWKCLEV